MFGFSEGKRYNSFVGYYRRRYGERLQKLVLDAGFSCPNRDGTVGRGGCTYCDNAAFHPGYSTPGKPLLTQIDEGIEFQKVRYPRARHYLAYFQAYSNTYGPLDRLKALYEEVLSHPEVVGIVIGTRAENEVGSGVDASFGGHFHGFAGALEAVAAVDVAQGAVVAGLDAVLHHHYGGGEGIRNRGLDSRSRSLPKGSLPP